MEKGGRGVEKERWRNEGWGNEEWRREGWRREGEEWRSSLRCNTILYTS